MRLDADSLAAAAAEAGLDAASIVVRPLAAAAAAVELDSIRPLYPASMIKVPLVAAALFEIARGRYAGGDPVHVDEANMTANDAESPLVPGYRSSPDELMHLAISRSDNVATNLLFDLVGRERATGIARERFGLPGTVFARKLSGSDPLIVDPQWDGSTRNAHPAADAARLFAAIARDEVPLAHRLLDMLAAQAWNEKLNPGLLPGDRFLHKTGDTSEVTHDGGILIDARGERWVVVAYTGLASTDEHNARFAPFMRRIRPLL
ncbi:MAG TPA: serine hydrolase [Candidatus Acidoferrales bacterium]|nr:serine hydrolase [Candidatus Acidoferrales bacterium]